MARILAIDYGKKRTGLAVTDELQIIASGLTTVPTKDLLTFLNDYCKNEQVETIVVGEPKRLHDEASDIEVDISRFLKKLDKVLPGIKVVRMDERFTSKMAFQSLIDSGLSKKKRQNKALLDEVSATIILQSYMDSRP
ncbi:Holliday junction resolvase RuvX [Robertkochia marina]|uniref:Putative pre-16S rRNA nuclease n=1 Tax=Robertkochia marina TaxID=1227945 RepID=A0A4V3UXV0_9FLAO|nr:Holliday junction resolvase RuvX [Robertkochia marina]THD65760.1 Holliday junction resolvase RuvX [Robertkochia marina]TRZ46555.1 Holliday junction resolvase RuvX [Robertkochia marina]